MPPSPARSSDPVVANISSRRDRTTRPSRGGVTSVVANTMSMMAPNTPWSMAPAGEPHLREDEADLAAGDHRDADEQLAAAEPLRRVAGEDFPTMPQTINAAPTPNERAVGEGAQVDGRADGGEEDRHEEVAERRRRPLDLAASAEPRRARGRPRRRR